MRDGVRSTSQNKNIIKKTSRNPDVSTDIGWPGKTKYLSGI